MRWCRRPRSFPNRAMSDPFEAVPVRLAGVEERADPRGCLHLRRGEALSPWRRRLAQWLRYDYSRKVELDEWGTLFFRLVDGKRSLRSIAQEIVRQSGHPCHEVEQAVLLFTRALMIRQYLGVRIPVKGGEERR